MGKMPAQIDIRIENFSKLSPEEIERRVGEGELGFPEDVGKAVGEIIGAVSQRGDEALVEYTKRFDGVGITSDQLRVTEDEITAAQEGLDPQLMEALEISIRRVEDFHRHALPKDWDYTDGLGNVLGQKCTPLERVGIYIPGGKASYPSSLIMTAVPALAAGVREFAVVSPPSSFEVPSALCAALNCIGCTAEVFRVGGVQGIAALALGTERIGRVDKIVGPGNVYVAMAKKELYGYVDIDMVAGPSEVLIIADGSVDPRLTAVDLLAQAEHDEDARAICVTLSAGHAKRVKNWTLKLADASPRREIIARSITTNGRIYVVDDMDTALHIANAVAPEHLELQIEDSRAVLPKIKHAGAIFLGSTSAEAFGDYVAGPSHVLPTGGTSRFFSPLNVLSFVKFSSVIEMSESGMRELSGPASVLADSEGLSSHADSVRFRLDRGN
jgi:histidinol dehydrogenase